MVIFVFVPCRQAHHKSSVFSMKATGPSFQGELTPDESVHMYISYPEHTK